MPLLLSSTLVLFLAQADSVNVRFPLIYQILCIVLTALFFLTFSIARNPRSWRRLYQAKVPQRKDHFSVNRNKRIDETLKRYGIIVAMVILVADVTCFVMGVTYSHRMDKKILTPEEQFKENDIERFKSGKMPGQIF